MYIVIIILFEYLVYKINLLIVIIIKLYIINIKYIILICIITIFVNNRQKKVKKTSDIKEYVYYLSDIYLFALLYAYIIDEDGELSRSWHSINFRCIFMYYIKW